MAVATISAVSSLPTPPPSQLSFDIASTSKSPLAGMPIDQHVAGLEISAEVPTPQQTRVRYERKLGDSELSYYLPSRANGVNDMFVHVLSYVALVLNVPQVSPPRIQGPRTFHHSSPSQHGMGHHEIAPSAPRCSSRHAGGRVR